MSAKSKPKPVKTPISGGPASPGLAKGTKYKPRYPPAPAPAPAPAPRIASAPDAFDEAFAEAKAAPGYMGPRAGPRVRPVNADAVGRYQTRIAQADAATRETKAQLAASQAATQQSAIVNNPNVGVNAGNGRPRLVSRRKPRQSGGRKMRGTGAVVGYTLSGQPIHHVGQGGRGGALQPKPAVWKPPMFLQ